MTSTPDHPSARAALLDSARAELVEKGHASVSLRAVARRAGVSHAAPAHFFGDRAGMLTAVATEGFGLLARDLAAADAGAAGEGQSRLAALGRAYVDFGLEHQALADLMFRRSELVPDDAELIAAQGEALAPLRDAVSGVAGDDAEGWSLVSWAVAHGLVVLAREGALAQIAGTGQEASDLARSLVLLYSTALTAPKS